MDITLLVVSGFLVWMGMLIYHLRRRDISDTDRIVWTVVICTLNILGVILYFCIGPAGIESTKARTEEELKEYFNSRSK